MFYIAVFAAAALLTWGIRSWTRAHGIYDEPNARSSHKIATPKGGGVAVVVVFFAALLYLKVFGAVATGLFWALCCSLPIVIVGLIDDLYPLSARLRLVIQGGASLAAIFVLGGVDVMDTGLFVLEGAWVNGIALLMLIWMTNLYNFLDGIDGYAGSEAVFAGVAAFCLFGSDIGLLIALSALGFLIFNWHRASIFMGDVGSAPLGFIFGVLALYDAGTVNFAAWLVLLSLFWFDATVTLWRRWRNAEPVYQAHKKHAYQRLHQAGWPHDRVVLAGMGLNLILFVLLWFWGPGHYGFVFLAAVALLWLAMKYVDRQKAFS